MKNVIYNFKSQGRYLLLAFAIMSDHFHLLLVPMQGYNISSIMHSIKRGSSRLINQKFNSLGKIWEPRYFDKVARSEKELLNDIEYIHSNPVKVGLVEKPEDYSFSSANPEIENDLNKYLTGEWYDARIVS